MSPLCVEHLLRFADTFELSSRNIRVAIFGESEKSGEKKSTKIEDKKCAKKIRETMKNFRNFADNVCVRVWVLAWWSFNFGKKHPNRDDKTNDEIGAPSICPGERIARACCCGKKRESEGE